MVYPAPLSTTDASITYDPPGPCTVPARLASFPFSSVPVRSIITPANSWWTAASPLILSESGFILNAGSVSICAVTEPSSGPAVNPPSPEIKKFSPSFFMERFIRKEPPGPSRVPLTPSTEPSTISPWTVILFPNISIEKLTGFDNDLISSSCSSNDI